MSRHRNRHLKLSVNDRRSVAHKTWLALVSAIAVVAMSVGVGVTSAGAQEPDDCVGGIISAEVIAESLPGGAWSVTSVCVPQDQFYEFNHEQFRLVLGLAEVTYDGGHFGRLAFGILKFSDSEALAVVGMEDAAKEFIRWAGALGSYELAGTAASVAGDGIAVGPDGIAIGPQGVKITSEERARVALSVDGVGTDLAPIVGPDADSSTPTPAPNTVVDPGPAEAAEDLTVDGQTSLPTSTTIAPRPAAQAPVISEGSAASKGPVTTRTLAEPAR